VVSLVKGEDRRKNIFNALVAIDDQIKPKLKSKKYVLIKPNNVGTVNQLGNTHADAIRGILDSLEPRFKGPVVIGESSAGLTRQGFENFKYPALINEYKRLKISLVDFNEEAKYVQMPLIDYHLHVVPARLAARLFDPEAFIISSALFKSSQYCRGDAVGKEQGPRRASAPGSEREGKTGATSAAITRASARACTTST
jgi:hypothetical protein